MIDIISIEIISIVSFLYSLLTMFIPFAPINQIFLVYIWTIIVSVVFALNQGKSRVYDLSVLLLLLPLIFYNDIKSIIFILITMIIIFLYIKKSLLKGNYYTYANKLKVTSIVYIVLTYMKIVANGFQLSMGDEISFFIMYLLSSIILIRSVRHLNSNMDIKKIRRNNIMYIVFISISLFIANLDSFRKSLFLTVSNILDTLLLIIYYPLYLLWLPIEKIMFFFMDMESKQEVIQGAIENTGENPGVIEDVGEHIAKHIPKDFTIFKIIAVILLILLSIYIIYKLIIKAGNKQYEGLEYSEEREFIKEEKNKRKGRFTRDKYPKELKEQIRYYYRRYLNKLKKQNIEINNSDTSLEINSKAEMIYEKEIEKIREIYIESRYSDKIVDEYIVQEMEEIYKQL